MKFGIRQFVTTGAVLVGWSPWQVFATASIDLSREPDGVAIAAEVRSGRLAEFRKSLGEALATAWEPSRNGRPGSCSQESFARWVDLYQWIDLLESDEAAVTKRWLSRHLVAGEEQKDRGKPQQVLVLQPGSPLVRRYDAVQHRATEEIARDPGMIGQVLSGLVAQPFAQRNGPLIGRLDQGFVAATVSDPDFLRRWSESQSEDDFAPKVLENLQSIWKSDPLEWSRHNALALAIAVVMDQPPPPFWPHRQVNPAAVPRSTARPAEVFSQWVSAARDGKLRLDPTLLEVRELKFVIDYPVDPSEFDSVRNTPALSRKNPPQAFESITYDQGRIAKGVYLWPWGPYTLSSIRKHGGICVDQAYYAAISGKALGIPSIFFAGIGKEGGHAWVGYLKGPRNWDLGVGRNGERNVATGQALDPQAWVPVTDHDLEMLTRHLGNKDSRDAARRDLVMAWNFRRRGDATGEGNALTSALTACPENPALWDAREDCLVRTGSPTAEIRSHHEAAIRQFSRFRDLKAQHQEALVRLALGNGDRPLAERLSGQIVNENRGGRSDLSAAAAGQLIAGKIDANDPDSAVREYTRQLRLQGADGGGDFFYKVVLPLATLMNGKGRQDLARLVLKQAHDTLRPPRHSLVDRDLRKLWLESGGR